MNTETQKPDHEKFHFYASSAAEWMTTTPTRDLRQLLRYMDKQGYGYNLFLVPLPWNAEYKIGSYTPLVPGIVFMGYFTKKGKK